MRIAKTSKRFRKDYAKLKKSGRHNMQKLKEVMGKLINDMPLSPKHKDHQLQGELNKYRDCHIENDWVLLYEYGINESGNETIIFHATDNHSNLFD